MFSKLFVEGDCQECSSESFGFSDCELLVDIGPFKRGEIMASIWYFTESGELVIYPTEESMQTGKSEFKCKAVLQVIPSLDPVSLPATSDNEP